MIYVKRSLAYVRALAARAGFSTSVPEPDRDSLDLRIMAHGPRRPALDLQLKATTHLPDGRSGFLPFRLRIKNYGDLCVETQTPRLLVLLELPKDESRWMTVTPEELILRRRAYWLSRQQAHQGPVDQQAVTVHVLEANVLASCVTTSRSRETLHFGEWLTCLESLQVLG